MKGDVHGRDALAKNILTNWLAQLVQIAAGFVVPRLIDTELSQQALGVWDLAWSIVVYLNIVQVGVTSSINRYVAYHRAQEDYAGINRVVSSIVMVMRGMGGIVVLLTLLATWQVGDVFSHRLGTYTQEARWLVFLLGTGIAIQISSAVYASLLTGFHRWDWHNGIHAGTNVVMLAGMVLSLKLGFGLIGLAVVHVVSETLGRTCRVIVAHRLCPWLEVRVAHFRASTAREMMGFGGKAFVSNISQLIMNSTVSLMIAAHLGPAALALYSRPMSLVRNLTLVVNKYAMVFSPTISSLQGAGRDRDIRQIALQATRYGLYILLPPTIVLLIYSREIMRWWMGDAYAVPVLVVAIILGSALQMAVLPLWKGALVGLNIHGKAAIANVAGAAVAVAGTYIALAHFHLGLVAVAIAVGVPMSLTNGLFLAVYACRKLDVGFLDFLRQVWGGPLACAAPFAAILAVSRVWLGGEMGLLAGGFAGMAYLMIAYWHAVVPERYKQKLGLARSRAAAQRVG